MESMCSDELTHFDAGALKVLTRTSRELRSTALYAMRGGLTIKGLADDASLESAIIHARRLCEARFRLKRMTLSPTSGWAVIESLEPLKHLRSENLVTLKCIEMRNVTSLEPLRYLHALQCRPMAGQLGAKGSVTTLDCNRMENVTSLEPLRDLKRLQCRPLAGQLGAFGSVTTLDCSYMTNVTSFQPLASLDCAYTCQR